MRLRRWGGRTRSFAPMGSSRVPFVPIGFFGSRSNNAPLRWSARACRRFRSSMRGTASPAPTIVRSLRVRTCLYGYAIV